MPIDISIIPFSVGLPEESEMVRIGARVCEVATAFAGLVTTANTALSAAEQKCRAEAIGSLGPRPTGADGDGMSSRQRADLENAALLMADRRFQEYRRQLLASSDKNRTDMLGQLRTDHERLSLAVKATPTPVAMLGMYALGTDTRDRYETQLREAGPATVGNAVVRAIASGDLHLAAAVLARLDSIPKNLRPVETHEFAEKVVGDRHRVLLERTERARIALDAAVAADRHLRTGAKDSLGKISRGLALRKLGTAA